MARNILLPVVNKIDHGLTALSAHPVGLAASGTWKRRRCGRLRVSWSTRSGFSRSSAKCGDGGGGSGRSPSVSAARSRGSIGAAGIAGLGAALLGDRRARRRPKVLARAVARLVHAAVRARGFGRRGHEREQPSMPNWSRAAFVPARLAVRAARSRRPSPSAGRSAAACVSHSQPRKTTVRTRGRSSRDTVPSCRYQRWVARPRTEAPSDVVLYAAGRSPRGRPTRRGRRPWRRRGTCGCRVALRGWSRRRVAVPRAHQISSFTAAVSENADLPAPYLQLVRRCQTSSPWSRRRRRGRRPAPASPAAGPEPAPWRQASRPSGDDAGRRCLRRSFKRRDVGDDQPIPRGFEKRGSSRRRHTRAVGGEQPAGASTPTRRQTSAANLPHVLLKRHELARILNKVTADRTVELGSQVHALSLESRENIVVECVCQQRGSERYSTLHVKTHAGESQVRGVRETDARDG